MTPLTDDENSYYEEQKQCYICRNHFVIIKNKKRDLNYAKKLEESFYHLLENLEELLIAFVIYTKYLEKFL